MGSEAGGLDRWERQGDLAFRLLPYLLLAVSVTITLVQSDRPLTVLALSAAAAVWLLCFHTLRPSWHDNRPLMGLYYCGLMALAAVLVAIAPWYGLFAFAGYPQAFHYLDGWRRYAGATVTALISAVAFLGGVAAIDAQGLWAMWAAVGAISAVLAVAFFYFIDKGGHRDIQQRQALAEVREANARLETALAENAALHAQLLVQAREAGVLDERQRMAREIHDTLAQSLAGILTQLQAAEQTLADPSVSLAHMATATTLARDGLAEARRSVHAVRPAALAETRLADAIGDVARNWSAVNRVDAVLTLTGDARPMRTDVEVALLRTAQEALANVAKHARASRVGLTLSYMEDVVTLDVRDDGVGFDPAAERPDAPTDGGFGLTAMRQRVRLLAGLLNIESEPGAGTAVSVTVPVIPAGGAR